MGSEAGYSLKAADAPRAVVGRGSIHMEANYGVSFPTGWVWAQVSSYQIFHQLPAMLLSSEKRGTPSFQNSTV